MRVLFEEDVKALLVPRPPGAAVSCLVDLRAGTRARLGPAPRLSEAAGRALAEGVMREARVRGAGQLDVALYGGEPLCDVAAVLSFSRHLRRGCLRAGMGFAAHVLTRGALLDGERARCLAEAGVARLQVTLGPTRARPGGRRTGWRRTLDAVRRARQAVPIVLRVRPDASCDFEALVQALEERGLVGEGPSLALYLAGQAAPAQQARELIAISGLLDACDAPRVTVLQ